MTKKFITPLLHIGLIALLGLSFVFRTLTPINPVYAVPNGGNGNSNNDNEKWTICHATESESNPYTRIVVSSMSQGGHFDNSGTPESGHEDDILYEGEVPCPDDEVDPTPTPTEDPEDEITPTPTPTPTEDPEDEITPTPTLTPTLTPTPTEDLTPTPTCAPDSSLVNGVCAHPQPQNDPFKSVGGVQSSNDQPSKTGLVLGASTLAATGTSSFADIFSFPATYSIDHLTDSLPTRVDIDGLGLSLPVYSTSIENGGWQISDEGISYLSSSSRPGLPGSTILYGHNSNDRFGPIRWLQIGQTLTLSTINGQSHRYLIFDITTIDPSNINSLIASSETLVLYTCTGPTDSQRLVVKATPIQ